MKIASSGDWHIGAKNGSQQHCLDVVDFMHFVIDECKKRGVTQFVHTGDFFDKRDKIDTLSLNYGLAIVNEMHEYFDKVVMLKGNHDIMKRDDRNPSSIQVFERLAFLVNEYEMIDDVMYVSWICSGEEFDNIVKFSKKNKIKYMFGHFEFANFKVNEQYTMEHGQTHKSLKHIKQIISGHYHSRQEKDNVLYNGAPFPLNYSNANEENLGFSILDTETGEVEFVVYDKIKILSMPVKQALSTDMTALPTNTSIRVIIDEDIDDDAMEKLHEELSNANIRDVKVVYTVNRTKDFVEAETSVTEIMSIDDAVLSHLNNMVQVDGISNPLLVEIYKKLLER